MKAAQPHARSRAQDPMSPAQMRKRSAELAAPLASSTGARDGAAKGGRVVRVLCVDDHAVLIEGLAARFALEDGIELVGRCPGATRLVEECDRLKPDVVILDIEMPGPDAFEVADRLMHRDGGVRVMVLSAHVRDVFITAAFRAGASAYFAKSDELSDIVRGIYDVARCRPTEFVLGPKVREKCRPVLATGRHARAAVDPPSDHGAALAQPRLESLTTREFEILRLIGKGMSRTQIAAELCRSAKTVDAHQSRMMKKLGVTARVELMRLAIREGLAEA